MTRWGQDLPAWAISLVINFSLLALLHFIVLEQPLSFEPPVVTTVFDDIEINQQEINFVEDSSAEEVGNVGNLASLSPSLKSATALGNQDAPLTEKIEEVLNPEIAPLTDVMAIHIEGDVTAAVDVRGHSDNVTGGVEGAMDRIAFEIRQSLRERKTLVIWLFDASGSLTERRETIAKRFDNIYRQLNKTGTTEGLYSALVSYGEKSELLTEEPIQNVAQLSELVRKKIKEDKSGIENVFSTVKLVLEKFRTWKRSEGPWNKMIIIVTDERGDDAEAHLEEVISLAKRSQTRVYTIGNAAIFGRKEGYVRYEYDDGFVDYIPVDQGPESAFPDNIQLPFVGSGDDWKLRQMSSNYGPYALTRLSSETGGMYLITEESRGYTFDRAIMRSYAPDYRPVPLQEAEIRKNPAKSALVQVAAMTYEHNLPIPRLTFRAYNDNILRRDLTEAQRPAAEIDYSLRQMHEVIQVGEKARDTLKEDRWRAAFDLAMGRLLAMRVRYFGYNQMLADMKVSPRSFKKEQSNMWRLVPSDEIATGPQMRKHAEDANRYLQRVIDEHPGTPWAQLAQKELSTSLGWSWEEFSLPIPGSDQLRGSDEEVARLLLADEEQRRRERQQMEKPRERPKL